MIGEIDVMVGNASTRVCNQILQNGQWQLNVMPQMRVIDTTEHTFIDSLIQCSRCMSLIRRSILHVMYVSLYMGTHKSRHKQISQTRCLTSDKHVS